MWYHIQTLNVELFYQRYHDDMMKLLDMNSFVTQKIKYRKNHLIFLLENEGLKPNDKIDNIYLFDFVFDGARCTCLQIRVLFFVAFYICY